MIKHVFHGQIQQFSDEDTLRMIDKFALAEIKKANAKPTIHVFAVAHEGETNPTILGLGTRVVQFFKDAIIGIHNKVFIGTPVFKQHGKDNSHDGRNRVGEIVGKSLKFMKGKLYSLAAVYIYPDYQKEEFNVASIEANVEMRQNGNSLEAVEVVDVSGLALSNSAVERPGFPDAILLKAIAAFEETLQRKTGETDMKTLEEVREAIKAGGYAPGKVYSSEELADDRAVKTIVKEAKTEESGFGTRKAKELDDYKKATEAELTTLRTTNSKQSAELFTLKSTDKVNGFLAEKKVSDKAKAYINLQLKKAAIAGDTDEDRSKSLTTVLAAALEEATALGLQEAPTTDESKSSSQGSEQKTDKGAGPTQKSASSVPADMDPKSNPFIPQ